MLILLDCRPLQYAATSVQRRRLILSFVAGLTRDKGVKWLLLVDHTYRAGVFPGLPDLPLLLHRALPGWAGWKLWYDWQIPRLVRKHRPDLVMLTGGVAAAPMQVPQALWMPVRANPKEANGSRQEPPLYASRLGSSLRRAEAVFCFSEKDRAWLAGRKDTVEEKLVVLRPAPSQDATQLSAVERERIKGEYAQGKEYFFTGATAANDVVYLLKAFSLFKKRQLSNLQLVIVGVMDAEIREKLETYKYRKDVHWNDPATVCSGLLGAAYAALLRLDGDSLGATLVDAWKSGVPVLAAKEGWLQEIAGDAVLGTGDTDPAILAGYMMAVYKDEALRGNLIEKGFLRLSDFHPERSVSAVWATIGRAYPIIN